MAKTFDEATENINALSAFSTVYGISPTVVRDIISKLKEEYAPTVEMTQSQKNVFELAKQTLKTSNLANVVEGQGPAYSILNELSGRVWGHNQGKASEAQIEKTMHAWLHPETIKVVD